MALGNGTAVAPIIGLSINDILSEHIKHSKIMMGSHPHYLLHPRHLLRDESANASGSLYSVRIALVSLLTLRIVPCPQIS